jgi:hypothetical protein
MKWLLAMNAQAGRFSLCELSIVIEAREFTRSHKMPTSWCGSKQPMGGPSLHEIPGLGGTFTASARPLDDA